MTDRPAATDIVVIGGGIVGASVAYELATAGRDVVVVDPARPGRASAAGAGIASPQTFADPDPQWHRFGEAAATHLRELVERLRHDDADPGADAFAECGSLVVALAEHEDPWFEEAAVLAMRRDPEVVEISASDAQGLFPVLCRPWRALFSPHSARVDGRGLTRALHAALSRRATPVVATEVGELSRRGDRVVSVSTTEGSIGCDQVVLAAGAWSAALAAPLGATLPVAPTKGEIVHLATAPTGEPGHDTGTWPIVQPVLNFYLVPWASGRVACGGTFDTGAGFDVRPTAAGLRDLLRESLVIAPGLGAAAVVETRVGLRPTTPDDRPVLGPLGGTANVHVCTGHGANGLLLGPYSGALVAGSILGGGPDALPPYSADRFREV
jgi:D-amino-acid dehydrogenase